MIKRSVKLFLKDIITFIDRIEEYTKNLEFEGFETNNLIIDAVLRNLELIGEAAKQIPEEITKKYSEIPWSDIIGLRNIAAHGYFKIDLTIIWTIIKKEIFETKPKIIKIKEELFPD